jgi:hypothetical protein
MSDDAVKGQAVSAISAFNARQTSTVEMIDIAPGCMRVLNQDFVIQETARERVMISRRVGTVFEVVGRQRKP